PAKLNDQIPPSDIQMDVEAELPQRIVRRWQQRVDADLASEPLSENELTPLSDTERASVLGDPRVAYGSTLVAALLLPGCAIYLQLGDGDILVVDAPGNEPNRPLRPDGRSFANETASLAPPAPTQVSKRPVGGSGPWADFRTRVVPVTSESPALVFLTTD